MGLRSKTFIGPFAEWRFPESPPLRHEVDDFVEFGAGPYGLSTPWAPVFWVKVEGVEYARVIYFPRWSGSPEAQLPRDMYNDGVQLAGHAILEASGNRIDLGQRFGAVAAVLELGGVDPNAELDWFRAVYREHLERLSEHYDRHARLAWGLIGYEG
jgi:hypothetical protein